MSIRSDDMLPPNRVASLMRQVVSSSVQDIICYNGP
jgi:hypothetical protein